MKIRQLLHTLSGDDYSIIAKCNLALQFRFAAIGFLVVCIFILCFISSYFAFTMLFQSYVAGIPIAIFFAFMITNIYLLLLYTLSKNVLPHMSTRKGKLVSRGGRLLFICFISIVVSKPIESLIFNDELEKEIQVFKTEKIRSNIDSIDFYYKEKIQLIEAMQVKLKSSDLAGYIQRVENQKQEAIAKMIKLVNTSNYYIHRIRLLNHNYKSWLVTLLSFLIFVTPVYLKLYVSINSNYYRIKSYIESKLVHDEYNTFKKQYRILSINSLRVKLSKNTEGYLKEITSPDVLVAIEENCNEKIQNLYLDFIKHVENYEDPPFNTLRKKDKRKFLKEDDLIAELYNA